MQSLISLSNKVPLAAERREGREGKLASRTIDSLEREKQGTHDDDGYHAEK